MAVCNTALAASKVRLGAGLNIQTLIIVALGSKARCHELLAALKFVLGIGELRLGRGHLRLCARNFCLIRRWVDFDQKVALLDDRAFLEGNRLDGAGDARAYFNRIDCLKPAREFAPLRYELRLYDRNGNRSGWRRRGLAFFAFRVALLHVQKVRAADSGKCQNHGAGIEAFS